MGGCGMNARTARPMDSDISRLWVHISMRRLSERSAIAPAHADRKRIGPVWQAAITPTASPLWVRWYVSSRSATFVSQLPTFEID